MAVAAVLLYHGDISWARGGYLGVDAFFVLSGFLITSLLLAEWRGDGRIALSAFWGRRAGGGSWTRRSGVGASSSSSSISHFGRGPLGTTSSARTY